MEEDLNKEQETKRVIVNDIDELGTINLSVKPIDTFVYMEDTKKILQLGIDTGRNVLLYGPGGYGKSEYVEEYLASIKVPDPYVFTMGSGITTDRLFGGIDMKTFDSTGRLEYLIENSFMNHEFVIFEELLDAPDFILEQLKDILSSRQFRNGSQRFEIRTKFIVGCTNRSREEFSKNMSLRALMERFPLEYKVIWKDHNRITYDNLFKTKLGCSNPMLSYILEQYAINGQTISPRIAIVAEDVLSTAGPDALAFIAEFSAKPEVLKEAIAKFKGIEEFSNISKEINDIVVKIRSIDTTNLQGIKDGNKLNTSLFTAINKLNGLKKIDDTIVAQRVEMVKTFNKIFEDTKKALGIAISLDDSISSAVSLDTNDTSTNSGPF